MKRTLIAAKARQAKSNLPACPRLADIGNARGFDRRAGNPGPKYHLTRHNAGADLLRELANGVNGTWKSESKFFGETCRLTLGDRDIRLLIPSTFMNLSGSGGFRCGKFLSNPSAKNPYCAR